MDDLLNEFLTETSESIESLDVEVVRLEQDPNDPELLSNIFRLVHTIKGTCGFLGLPRLEAVAHSGENVLGKFRDGNLEVTPDAVSLILESLDRIKMLLAALEETEAEPEGDDSELISRLDAMANGESSPAAAPVADPEPLAETADAEEPAPAEEAAPAEEPTPAAPAAVSNKPLIERVGGISAVDAAVELLYRKIMKDEELTPFFEGVDMILLQGRQVEFMTKVLGGPDNYAGGDLRAVHKNAVEHGLDETHFDKVAGYLKDALSELEVPEDVAGEILAIVGTTRNDVLNIDEVAAQPEVEVQAESKSAPAKAVAVKDKQPKETDGKEAGPSIADRKAHV